jgi:hypothetical protein
MKRSLPALAFSLLILTACATRGPYPEPSEVNPVTDPTVIGAVDEAAIQGKIEGEKAAVTGHRIGIVFGTLAAVLGGGSHDSLDEAIGRYIVTHDLVATTVMLAGATKGTVEGAKHGAVLDQQFAELHAIVGVTVLRPYPDDIEIHVPIHAPGEVFDAMVNVFANREPRVLDLYGKDESILDVRDALLSRKVVAAQVNAHRDETVEDGVVIVRVRYND